jgi:signal transduction histidine kinase
MLANVGAFVAVSLTWAPGAAEHRQASLFVDVFKRPALPAGASLWRGTAAAPELYDLLSRFVGAPAAEEAFEDYARLRGLELPIARLPADADLVHFVETQLAGVIGAASARIMVASVVKEEAPSLQEVRAMLDEASQIIVYSHRLEQKSQELERATRELRAANERLTEIDRMKDEFVSTVSHELRTPLTSIRAFSEILHDHPGLPEPERARFLGIITKETERLTRLINQILDLSRLESGRVEWRESLVDLREVIRDTLAANSQLFKERDARLEAKLPERVPKVRADLDRIVQVIVNLLSNAAKFVEPGRGRVEVTLVTEDGFVRVDVRDNGPGVAPRDRRVIFDKFRQGGDPLTGKPQGSGLGLHISRHIVEHFGGRIWVSSGASDGADGGACFSFTLPVASGRALERAA